MDYFCFCIKYYAPCTAALDNNGYLECLFSISYHIISIRNAEGLQRRTEGGCVCMQLGGRNWK